MGDIKCQNTGSLLLARIETVKGRKYFMQFLYQCLVPLPYSPRKFRRKIYYDTKLNFKVQFFFLFLYERERERIGPWLEFYQFQFAAGLALSSLTLLRLYLCVFVSDHVHVCVVCWCFSVMELCRISFLLLWAFQLVYAQQTTDPNEGSLSCLKIQKLVEVEFHLYSFKVSKF